jgi:hypothetical protein
MGAKYGAARPLKKANRVVGLAALMSLMVAAGCGPSDSGEDTPAIRIEGHEVQSFDEWGVNEHLEGDITYRQTPPVVGPHSVMPALCGTFSEPIPDENFVHTLEHGAVAVLFSLERQPGRFVRWRPSSPTRLRLFPRPIRGSRLPLPLCPGGA